MPSNVTIRAADPQRDAEACAAIYAPYVRDTAITFEEVPPTVEEFAVRIVRAHAWLVAERDGAIVGFAYATTHRERAAYRWAADVTIYIAAGHHREGIGRALYEPLLDGLRAGGWWVVFAGVTQPNPGSVGLHQALGFAPLGTYRRVGFKLGAWHDVMWMQCHLQPAACDAPPAPTAEHPAAGGCLCGAVRYEVRGPFRRANMCHCSRCRKHSGSVGLVQGRVASEHFALLTGADEIEVFRPPRDGMAKAFCRRCGSSLFGGTWPDGPEVSIRFGTLDDDPGIRPQYHSFADDVPPWDRLPDDGLPRWPGAPKPRR